MTNNQAGAKYSLSQTAGLGLVNRQRLALSVQMRQKLQLLHMPAIEVARFVTGEMARNPLLQRLPFQDSGGQGGSRQSGKDQDFSVSDLIDNKSAHRAPSLAEHLHEQIIFSFTNIQERHIADYLTGELDESGYFHGDLNAIARELSTAPRLVETVFAKLQQFDPPGIFARSLAECLHLQLERQGLFDPIFAKLLQTLPLIAQRDFTRLEQLCGVTQDELMRRLALIKKLDPKPGLAFGTSLEGEANPVIIADAFIDHQADGSWHVEINQAVLPKLIIDKNYSQTIGNTREERQFIKNFQTQAQWLIRALDARAQTLIRVICAIAEVQQDFLAHGASALKPLTLSQIAAATNLHESTISRTIAHKYVTIRKNGKVSRPQPLHQFFSAKLASSGGQAPHAAKAIEAQIALLIAGERTPLTDEALVRLLREQGVEIARRTVTKYRQKMRIPPSHLRQAKSE